MGALRGVGDRLLSTLLVVLTHRDPLPSTGRTPFLHCRHVWVVLSIEVTLFDESWALPVLFRLHRSEKRYKAQKKPYRKLTEHGRELVELLAKR